MDPLRLFTTVMTRFARELMDMYPDDMKLQLYGNGLLAVQTFSPETVHRYFLKYVTPLRESIVARDESLFTEGDVPVQLQEDEVSQENLLEAMRIRSLWKDMDTATRDSVWRYLNLLVQTSERISSENK